MNKSQRASETQSRKLQRSIANIRKEITPVPTVSSIGSNPKAKPLSKTAWLRRTVRITGSVALNYAAIGTAMGANTGETYTVKVLGIKAWNATAAATNTNSILVQLDPSALAVSSGIQGEDYGNASHLPGVKINIPDVLSTTNVTSSTTAFCTVSAPGGGSATQYYVVDVDILYRI